MSPNFYLLSYTTVNFGNTKNIEFVSVFGYAEVCPPLWKRHADGRKSKFMPIQQTEERRPDGDSCFYDSAKYVYVGTEIKHGVRLRLFRI